MKLTIAVPPEAFNPPTRAQEITVNDWRQGIELSDVEFRQSTILPEEAELVRQRRLEKMRGILERRLHRVEAGGVGVMVLYMVFIGLGWAYMGHAFHWPTSVIATASFTTAVFAFYLSRVIEDDRR